MKYNKLDSNQKKIVNIALVLCIPMLFGIYKSVEAQLIELPYMLREDNAKVVKYTTVKEYCQEMDATYCEWNARGYRSEDSLLIQVGFDDICAKFDTIPAEHLKELINNQGMEILTFFGKKNQQKGYVLVNDSQEEIRRIWRNTSINYITLLALPLIVFLSLIGILKLGIKIFQAVLFLFVGFQGYGQINEPIALDSFIVFTAIETDSKGAVHIYSPPYQLKKEVLDTSDISLEYPEEVILAILCAKDNSWLDFISESGNGKKKYKKDSHYKALQSASAEDLYFELEAKFSFSYQGRYTTFIKYVIVDQLNNLRFKAMKALVNIGGRYKESDLPIDGNLGLTFLYLKNDVLKNLFLGNRTPYPDLYDKVYENGSLNLIKLTSEFTLWYADEEKHKNEIEKYTTSPNW